MNKRIMVIWGMLVFIIIATLLIIGFNKKDKVISKIPNYVWIILIIITILFGIIRNI